MTLPKSTTQNQDEFSSSDSFRADSGEAHSLARDSVGTTLINIAVFFLGVIIWVANARILDPIWRGILALIMILPATIIKAGTFGSDLGIVVLGGENKNRLGLLTRSGVLFGFIIGILGIGLVLGFMYGFPQTFWRVFQHVWLPQAYLIIVMIFPIHLITQALDAAIYAEDRISARNRKDFLVNLITLIVLFFLVLIFDLNLFAVIGSYMVANTFNMIYAAWLLKGRISLFGKVDISSVFEAIKLGFPVYLANLASFLMLPSMMLLLSLMLPDAKEEAGANLANIAFFTMGYQMVERILPVTRSIAFALLPKITTGSESAAGELAGKASRHTILASILIFGILLIFIKPIIALLLGTRYLPTVIAFVIIAPAGVLMSASGVWSAHLLARHRPYRVALAGISGVLSALVFAGIGFFLCQPGQELVIASFAVLTGSLVNSLILLFAFCQGGKISISDAARPGLQELSEWSRIPGLIKGFIVRRKNERKEGSERD